MRCSVPVNFYAFVDATSADRVLISGLQVGPDVVSCLPGELVLLSYAEVGNVTANPFRLDLNEAGPIVGAVLLIWSIGFAFRMFIRALRSDESAPVES